MSSTPWHTRLIALQILSHIPESPKFLCTQPIKKKKTEYLKRFLQLQDFIFNDKINMSEEKFRELVMDRQSVESQSWAWLSDWTELN